MSAFAARLSKSDLFDFHKVEPFACMLWKGPLLQRPGRPLSGSSKLATNAVNWALAVRQLSCPIAVRWLLRNPVGSGAPERHKLLKIRR